MKSSNSYYHEGKHSNTYAFDEDLPPLPLPDLRDTMKRYYQSLLPFGNERELAFARKVINDFEKGVGAVLHDQLKERSKKMKNWLDGWWEMYAYHISRQPLLPYTSMASPLKLDDRYILQTPSYALKNLARIIYHSLEFWDLLRKGTLEKSTSLKGQLKYSSALYKRFFSTTRTPGVEVDKIESHFKTITDGATPTHCIISGKGRLFSFDCLHKSGQLVTPDEILLMLRSLRCTLDSDGIGDCVPILTHSDRTTWAKNRKHLLNLSMHNEETLRQIESSILVIVLEDSEPKSYTEVAQFSIGGDYCSKWADRSSIIISYRNSKFALLGEHSCYDGTISVSYEIFIQERVCEFEEPIWSVTNNLYKIPLSELKFVLDSKLHKEIHIMKSTCSENRCDVLVTHDIFSEYGAGYIKSLNIHPDAFIQVLIQLTYADIYSEIAAIYETALMRHYYNGRTETVRSCSVEVQQFIQKAHNPQTSPNELIKAFYKAIHQHENLMKAARNGHGVDRHLFGLWCMAHESHMEIPELYLEPLYTRSGGNGNFTLSTSTLGNTVNVGFVAPMLLDGYGIFYNITGDSIHTMVSTMRKSKKTCSIEFTKVFFQNLHKIKFQLQQYRISKL